MKQDSGQFIESSFDVTGNVIWGLMERFIAQGSFGPYYASDSIK
jgi:hypothetical protein